MSIRILPELISNKIAAGEVVERPASVVKELVENALDAGSKAIMIEIDKGGRSLIRVSDDGCGMKHDDALLALERYATSKIFTDDDLFSIRTLGFRGEALPSIAAVSKFTIITRDGESDVGTEVRVEGGRIKQVVETGAPPGTMVSVKQLFYNTPARRKFLKTVNTEMGHIGDVVAGIALGRPDVHFKLIHNSKVVKSWPASPERSDRVVSVLGHDLRRELFAVNRSEGNMSVNGWIAAPRVFRKTARGIFTFVNGRHVRDKMIRHALFAGYTQRLVKGQYPLAVLYVSVPFDQVDVNVHPTKHEVRFSRSRFVHDLIKTAVAEVLDREDRPGWVGGEGKVSEEIPSYHPPSASLEDRPFAQDLRSVALGPKIHKSGKIRGKRTEIEGSLFQDPVSSIQYRVSDTKVFASSIDYQTRSEQADLWEAKRFTDYRIIGQIHNTYIVCEARNSFILIDQHAAHERVLYELLRQRSQYLNKESQQLLVPETIELSYRETAVIEKLLPDFANLGLQVEPFGGNTFAVKAVPALLAGREVKPLVLEIVEKLAEDGFGESLDRSLDACLKLMACHGAIRAGQALSVEQMKGLLEQMDNCENSAHCPHGRPTWIEWSGRDLEKLFNRIV